MIKSARQGPDAPSRATTVVVARMCEPFANHESRRVWGIVGES